MTREEIENMANEIASMELQLRAHQRMNMPQEPHEQVAQRVKMLMLEHNLRATYDKFMRVKEDTI